MPPGYAFYDLDTLLSDTARHILEDLLQKAKNRNPDVFDMFVYTGMLFVTFDVKYPGPNFNAFGTPQIFIHAPHSTW